MAGMVLAHFNGSVAPLSHLRRPLLVVAVLSVIVGVAALGAGRNAVAVAAAGASLLVAPYRWGILVGALVAVVLLFIRIRRKKWDPRGAIATMAAVFLFTGAVPAASHWTWGAPAHVADPSDDPPVFLVLLDAYPRTDTLAELGIDNSQFISALEARGFDHYPDAYTHHIWTFDVLSAMLGEEFASNSSHTELRRVRRFWRLPSGWATISSPASHVTIPHSEDLSPGGFTLFDLATFQDSLLSRLPGADRLIMSELRNRLASDLAAIGTTHHERVFAHLLSPHAPYLYRDDGSPIPGIPCWPHCNPFTPGSMDVHGLRGTLTYLNGKLVEAVDRILNRHPEATIVLFSDHGGRFAIDDEDEWHRIFLAARTSTPMLFEVDPQPEAIFPLLGYDS